MYVEIHIPLARGNPLDPISTFASQMRPTDGGHLAATWANIPLRFIFCPSKKAAERFFC